MMRLSPQGSIRSSRSPLRLPLGLLSACIILILGLMMITRVVGQQDKPDTSAPLQPTPDLIPSTNPSPPQRADSSGDPRASVGQQSDEMGPQPKPGVQLATFDDSENEGVRQSGAPSMNEAIRPLAGWEKPLFALFLTGRQHGYIEPCGCTGLENAKGGLMRRDTFLNQLRDRGWNVVALDVGNQVRRFGKQADIKFQRTSDVLSLMKYAAVGLGPDDLRLSLDGLLAPLSEGNFVCANVDIFELNAPLKIVEVAGVKIGVTSVLGIAEQKKANRNSELQFGDPIAALQTIIPKLREQGSRMNVLLAHASLDETREYVRRFPNAFDIVVTAGGAGEPTREPERIEGSRSRIVQVGTKGMYVGVIGVYPGSDQPVRYERVVLDNTFDDSPRVVEIFADYQKQLEIQGLAGLGIRPVQHPSGHEFVGYEACAECHTTAAEIFENTPHHHATASLVKPPNSRGAIPRHFDPECISCHVTGWNPQEYFPYESGYLAFSQTAMHTNGCENCHGPGSAHVAAESGDMEASDEQIESFRSQMRVTLDEARKTTCYACHDIDNSPDFDFDTYWPQVEHAGVD